MAANRPNRVGCAWTSSAPYSLQARASRRVTARSPKYKPGLVIEIIAAAAPPLSMSSIDCSGVHLGFAGFSSGRPETSAIQAGGEK